MLRTTLFHIALLLAPAILYFLYLVISRKIRLSRSETAKTLRKLPWPWLLFIGIGSSQIRSKLYSEHSKSDISFINIAHPTATLSKTIQVKEGSFFGPNSVVNAQANIGVCVIVNSAAVVEHDCVIGDFSHIAPRATIAGGVEVGRYTLIGGNSFINENIKIADNIIVGSGSVVPFDLLEAGTYVGNPVKKIK